MEKLLKTKDVAERLNCSQDSVRRYADKGLLPCRIIGTKSRRYSANDVRLFIERKQLTSK